MSTKDKAASLQIDPMYRMPVDFGPLPGPRNVPQAYADVQSAARLLICKVQARSERAALNAILPPGVSLDGEPRVNLLYAQLMNLGWLAGRGYNIVAVTIPVVFDAPGPATKYDYMPVLWESMADPVLTGREELGHPKLPASIPNAQFLRRTARGAAHWEGFRFCEFQMDDLRPDERPPAPPAPYLTRKYLPRTGEWGLDEIDQLTGPGSNPDPTAKPGSMTMHRRDRGSGSFRFYPARWEDMPTQYPIVTRLAELPLLEFVDASITDVEGSPGSGRNQAVLRELSTGGKSPA